MNHKFDDFADGDLSMVLDGGTVALRGQQCGGGRLIQLGAVLEPLPVQAPLAARIDQPITHQRLQDVLPARTFA